jgi:hypothetical protein
MKKRIEAITFPMSVEHSTFKDLELTSAGFVDIWDGDDGIHFKCRGYSESLGGLKANVEKDTIIFQKLWGKC